MEAHFVIKDLVFPLHLTGEKCLSSAHIKFEHIYDNMDKHIDVLKLRFNFISQESTHATYCNTQSLHNYYTTFIRIGPSEIYRLNQDNPHELKGLMIVALTPLGAWCGMGIFLWSEENHAPHQCLSISKNFICANHQL